jgi:predicted RNase H-like HicB family nuclease
VKKYTVDYVLGNDGWWTASVRDVRGAHTQGRSIALARRRIREALSLFVDGAERAELIDHIRIDADTRSVIRKICWNRSTRRRPVRSGCPSVGIGCRFRASLGPRRGVQRRRRV